MLRSLIWLEDREFDERHDLRAMAIRIEDLGLLRFGSRDEDFVSQVQGVARVWANTLRFAAEDQLGRHLKNIGEARNLDSGEIRRVCREHFGRCSQVVKRCKVLIRGWQKGKR